MIIREAGTKDIVGIAKVQVDTWRTSYTGIVPDEHLANMTYSKFEIGGVMLDEVAYGWMDIGKLLQD